MARDTVANSATFAIHLTSHYQLPLIRTITKHKIQSRHIKLYTDQSKYQYTLSRYGAYVVLNRTEFKIWNSLFYFRNAWTPKRLLLFSTLLHCHKCESRKVMIRNWFRNAFKKISRRVEIGRSVMAIEINFVWRVSISFTYKRWTT